MIDLYTWRTPNGYKVSIMLEACQLHYRVHPVDILAGEQFKPEFLRLNPNNKIPVIVDDEGPDGTPITVFESGAILLYLAEKTGLFIPAEASERYQVLQWLMWQMGSFGPFLGQAHHFNRFAPEPVPYAIERYNREAQRLWGVLEQQLQARPFVVNDLSIADFAIYPWCARHAWQQIEPAKFPAAARWMQQMENLPFVQRGMQVP